MKSVRNIHNFAARLFSVGNSKRAIHKFYKWYCNFINGIDDYQSIPPHSIPLSVRLFYYTTIRLISATCARNSSTHATSAIVITYCMQFYPLHQLKSAIFIDHWLKTRERVIYILRTNPAKTQHNVNNESLFNGNRKKNANLHTTREYT